MAQEGFIGEIRMFAGNFPPRSWAFCDGQLLAIAQNTALFSILGTTYGGDGRTSFGLPDLRGRLPVHAGNGPGLTPKRLGEKSGQETVTLSILELPSHNHTITNASVQIKTGAEGKGLVASSTAAGNFPGNHTDAFRDTAGTASLNSASSGGATGATSPNGGNLSHNNLQPYQTVNYIISLVGTYPSRS